LLPTAEFLEFTLEIVKDYPYDTFIGVEEHHARVRQSLEGAAVEIVEITSV
jgi:hypothetical protein